MRDAAAKIKAEVATVVKAKAKAKAAVAKEVKAKQMQEALKARTPSW